MEGQSPRKRARSWSRDADADADETRRHRRRGDDDDASARHHRSHRHGGRDRQRTRSRSPDTHSRERRRRHSRDETKRRADGDKERHHHHHHSKDRPSRHHTTAAAPPPPVELPYGARPLSLKADFDAFRPLFARYLSVQKTKRLGRMDEREARGRWKSFVAKWNGGTLANGWYDPEVFQDSLQGGFSDDDDEEEGEEGAEGRRSGTNANANSDDAPPPPPRQGGADGHGDDEDDDDDYGPTLPSNELLQRRSAAAARHGPGIPSLQDLDEQRELAESDRLERLDALRLERKVDRADQKARLEELAPRADPGTRARQLEKKKEVNDKMRAFRDKSPGAAEVNDGELMGGGESVDDFRRLKASQERKKTERELRREEIRRAIMAEREERLKEYRDREEGTIAKLKEIAKQRFG